MRKILTTIWLLCGLLVAPSVTAEDKLSRFFDSELFQSEVFTAAVTVAAETILSDWLESDKDESEPGISTGADDLTAVGDSESYDPLEKFNRMMFRFNTRLDSAAIKPLAETYSEYTPDLVQTGVRNFFGNIGDVGVAANSAMQGKFDQALRDSSRVAINSVAGLGGVVDVATALDFKKNSEDFGQTLAVWGVPEGPYIVLPLLGPRTLRSAVGTAVDTYIQLETLGSVAEVAGAESAVSELLALNIVDQRSRMFGAESLLEKAAIDPYLFAREAYLAFRRCQVVDCDKIDYVPAAPEGSAEDGAEQPSQLDNELDELELLDQLED